MKYPAVMWFEISLLVQRLANSARQIPVENILHEVLPSRNTNVLAVF